MPINRVPSFSEVLFVGPAPASGSSFLDVSGNYANYPIFFWPDNGVSNTVKLGVDYTGPFDNIFGKNGVYKTTTDLSVGYHAVYKDPNFGASGTLLKVLKNFDYYLPSSNQWVRSLFEANYQSTFMSGFDRWINFSKITDFKWDSVAFYRMALYPVSITANMTSVNGVFHYTGNGTDHFYIKNWYVVALSGQDNNNYFNTIRPMNKVQSINYSFNVDRQDSTQLGNPGTVYQPIVNLPTVNLEFETLTESFENEMKAGLTVNFNSFFSGYNGAAFFTGFRCPLSGFETRSLSGLAPQNGLMFPRLYTDKRNFYIKTAPEGKFFNTMNEFEQLTGCSSTAFGNCYLVNYRNSAQIGSPVKSNFNYLCENFEVNDSSIGSTPALNSKIGTSISGGYYLLPTYSGIDSPAAVVRPQDVIINISGVNNYSDFLSIGVGESNLKFQSYDLEINLNREPLESLGYKLPIDRVINYPVFATLNIQAIVGDYDVSSLNNFTFNDPSYDVDITLNNRCQFTGPDSYKNILGKFFFRGAKIINTSYNETVNGTKIINFSFSQEMNPLDFNKGLFMSGVVFGRNMPQVTNYNNASLHSIDFFHVSGNSIFTNGYF